MRDVSDMRMLAESWVHDDGAGRATRETAINEQHMALDVLDLLAERDATTAEVERLKKTLDDASYEDGDHLPKQCRRMIETLWGEICKHREQCPSIIAERDALRADNDGPRAVFEAAKSWRDQYEEVMRVNGVVVAHPMHAALLRAVDAALAECKEKP